MDLHGTDEWIFEELENAPVSEHKSVGVVVPKRNSPTFPDELDVLKRSIHQYELKQKADEAEKQIFVDNFYRLLVTARMQIKELEKKNAELKDRLTSYMSVMCPECKHCFRCNNSRILPDYIRYISACNRLELEFSNDVELKRWLVVSNLDTDASGLPVIRERSLSKTLTANGSNLVVKQEKKNKTSNNDRHVEVDRRSDSRSSKSPNGFRLDIENLSNRFSIKDIKSTFEKIGPVSEARFSESERNKAVVYFQYYRHLKRAIEQYQGKTWNGRRIRLVDRSRADRESPNRRRN